VSQDGVQSSISSPAIIANWTVPRCRFEVGGINSASALHFEPIFVDIETLDFRIERSREQT
jgi:hypothetical protein